MTDNENNYASMTEPDFNITQMETYEASERKGVSDDEVREASERYATAVMAHNKVKAKVVKDEIMLRKTQKEVTMSFSDLLVLRFM